MAVRTLNMLMAGVLLTALLCAPAQACFGPKLFVGVGDDLQSQALFALVTLYIQEKTGVESTRVEIAADQDPMTLLTGNKADLVFVRPDSPADVVFTIPGMPLLATGKRPLQELQFTTVLPAVRKLNRLLKQADVELLVKQIEAGDSAMSAARKFLMELRWI